MPASGGVPECTTSNAMVSTTMCQRGRDAATSVLTVRVIDGYSWSDTSSVSTSHHPCVSGPRLLRLTVTGGWQSNRNRITQAWTMAHRRRWIICLVTKRLTELNKISLIKELLCVEAKLALLHFIERDFTRLLSYSVMLTTMWVKKLHHFIVAITSSNQDLFW